MNTEKNKLEKQIEYLRARLAIAEDDVERLHHTIRDQNAELRSMRYELAAASRPPKKDENHLAPSASQSVQPIKAQGLGTPIRLSKKTILIVDCTLPKYDRSAGARSLHAYMRLFLAMGYDVAFLPGDFDAPQPYAAELEAMGVLLLAGSYYEQHWHLWVEQNAGYLIAAIIRHLEAARRFMRFIKENSHALILYFAINLELFQGQDNTSPEQALTYIVAHDADMVLLFDENQQHVLTERYGIKTALLPLYFYCDIPPRVTAYEETKGLLFVGAFSEKQNVDAVLWFIDEVLPLVRQALPGVPFSIVGANLPQDIRYRTDKNTLATENVTDEDLANYYRNCRVCVAPAIGNTGAKGKILEAMYYGVPLVSNRAGMAGLPGIEVVITPADSKEDFAAQVVQKYLNEREWQNDIGKYRTYLRNYAAFGKVEKMFRGILEGSL
ncbi:glycosyltransferase family 4 protein [Christensenellaceae bacterium OttesenSCG-928-K19]|nr:glycosyltransferase family 4 protein [Christensenellaceae bacterium OttesenSCG-928-K19]